MAERSCAATLKRIDQRLAEHRLNHASWSALLTVARAYEMPTQVVNALVSKVGRAVHSIRQTERHREFVVQGGRQS